MKFVLVVCSSKAHSSEWSISQKTAENVAEALLSSGFEVKILHDDDVNLIDEILSLKPYAVFNATHGSYGEDGLLRKYISDRADVNITHSGVYTSAICVDKDKAKKCAEFIGVPVAPSEKKLFKEFLARGTNVEIPYVVKPNKEGSSIGCYLIRDAQDLDNIRLDENTEILIEKYISGREFSVGVLNGRVLEVTEICPKGEFYDYRSKYEQGGSDHILPADISQELRDEMKFYTKQMYDFLGCKGPARVDFRYNSIDGVVMLEINNQPGMTKTSLLPEQAAYLGCSFEQLCVDILDAAHGENDEQVLKDKMEPLFD